MARRRKVSFPTSFGTVSFLTTKTKRKPIVFSGKSPGKRMPELVFSDGKVQFPLTIQGQKDWITHVKKERAKLKREIVKEVVARLEKEENGEDYDEAFEEYLKPVAKKAARLAIDLWEKRR